MKIITILGSPKRNGNTARVLTAFEEKAAGQGHEVKRVFIPEMFIKPCIGCMECQKTDTEPGCVHKDDAEGIFRKMLASDYILYATPLYCWGFSGNIRPFLDRHMSLVNGYVMGQHKSLLEGKRSGLLVTCGGPIENNADLIKKTFNRMCVFTKTVMSGKFILPNCNNPEDITEERVQNLSLSMLSEICG